MESETEFNDESYKEDIVKKMKIDMPTCDAFQSDLLSDVDQNAEVTVNILNDINSSVMQDKDILLKLTELQDLTIKLLQQKFQLLHINNDKQDECFTNVLEENILETSDGIKCEVKIITLQKGSTADTLKVLEETTDSFLEYIQAYKRCVIFIDRFHNSVEKQEIGNISASIEKLSNSVSTFKEHFLLYSASIRASRIAFGECESLRKQDLEFTNEDFNIMIDLLIDAIKNAAFSYSEVKSVIVDIIYF